MNKEPRLEVQRNSQGSIKKKRYKAIKRPNEDPWYLINLRNLVLEGKINE
uniref:Uncharacterized protein n=1 Tax=Tetranychus urticae TaxID=32264 RepID=T1KJP9_TETUR